MKSIGLKKRVVIGCVVFTMLLTTALGIASFTQYNRSITEKYHEYAKTVVEMAEFAMERNDMAELITRRSMEGGYNSVRESFNAIKERSNIAYLFAITFDDLTDPYSMCYIINGARQSELDAAEQERDVYSVMGEPCGEADFDLPMRKAYLQSMVSGTKEISYYENVTPEYGHMLTTYKVIFDKNGTPVGVLSVDLDMNDIQTNKVHYAVNTLIIAVIFMVLFSAALVAVMNRFVTGPITRIAQSANSFVGLMEQKLEPEDIRYEDTNVTSQDEIGMLSGDVSHMAQAVKTYMTTLRQEMKEKERIGAELELATRIQANMLPNLFPAFPGRSEFDIYASMTPAKEVGGDFYDFFLIDDDHLAMVIADVSGKGVPAALFMMASMILLNNTTRMEGPEASPGAVLTKVNNSICANNEEEMFVTVWLGILTISTGRVVASNAGHEYPMLKRADGSFELFKDRHGLVVGAMEGIRFRDYEFTLERGGALFVYTDGVAEATDAHDALFGTERTLEALNQNPDATPKALLEAVKGAVDDFVGKAPQFDDLTMLSVKRS